MPGAFQQVPRRTRLTKAPARLSYSVARRPLYACCTALASAALRVCGTMDWTDPTQQKGRKMWFIGWMVVVLLSVWLSEYLAERRFRRMVAVWAAMHEMEHEVKRKGTKP